MSLVHMIGMDVLEAKGVQHRYPRPSPTRLLDTSGGKSSQRTMHRSGSALRDCYRRGLYQESRPGRCGQIRRGLCVATRKHGPVGLRWAPESGVPWAPEPLRSSSSRDSLVGYPCNPGVGGSTLGGAKELPRSWEDRDLPRRAM